MNGIVLFESYIAGGISQPFRSHILHKRIFFARMLFVLTLVSIFEQIIQWLDQFGKNIDWAAMFLDTLTGQVWTAILLLSFIGLFIQRGSLIVLLVWSFLLLLAESMNGHIASLEAFSFGMLSDFVHLVCGALWAGGIAIIALSYKSFSGELLQLMERFMKIVWLTVIVLALSGLLLTILILPSWHYLFYTSWGQLLLIKAVLVIAAIYCGYKVREKIRIKTLPRLKTIWTEAGMLIAVIVLAGSISLISPEPNTTPLNYHKMGEELHYTAKLNPNAAGPNRLSLTLWTLEEDGPVTNVEIKLFAVDKPDRSYHSLVLQQVEKEDDAYEFPGFIESEYEYGELKLPYPTKWDMEGIITFASGATKAFHFQFENK